MNHADKALFPRTPSRLANSHGRFPGIGAVAFCALTAGWIAGQHARFPSQPHENLSSAALSPALPPLSPQQEFQAPQISKGTENGATAMSPANPFSGATQQSGQLSPDPVSQQDHDMTGFAQRSRLISPAISRKGTPPPAAANDTIVKTALEWVALRSFPRESGFERAQAFMQAHPAWPALDWLKRRSEEALFGDRKSVGLIKSFFSGTDPETPAGKLALARALASDGKTSEAAALARSVWREADLNPQLEAKIKSDFGSYLDKADHKFRADRLLYKEQTAAAFRAAALAGPDELALIKARAAVNDEAPSDKLHRQGACIVANRPWITSSH